MNVLSPKHLALSTCLALVGVTLSTPGASARTVVGPVTSQTQIPLQCARPYLYGPAELTIDDAFVEAVALWDVLDWGTCATTDYDPDAGRYYFTEAASAYTSLRTYFMTTDECTTNPCKSGYRYPVRYRTDLDIDTEQETIEGETKVYFVSSTFAASTSSVASMQSLTASTTVEATYAGKVTFSAEAHTYGDFGEPSYEFRAYDAMGQKLGTRLMSELIDLGVFCPAIANDPDDEIDDRVAGTLGTSGHVLEAALYDVVDGTAEHSTITNLSSGEVIETTVPAAVQSVDAVLRGHVATWLCQEDLAGPTGGGLPGGTGTVQLP